MILPRRSADLAELPDDIRRELLFVLVDDVTDAFEHALIERRNVPWKGRCAGGGAGRRHGHCDDPR